MIRPTRTFSSLDLPGPDYKYQDLRAVHRQLPTTTNSYLGVFGFYPDMNGGKFQMGDAHFYDGHFTLDPVNPLSVPYARLSETFRNTFDACLSHANHHEIAPDADNAFPLKSTKFGSNDFWSCQLNVHDGDWQIGAKLAEEEVQFIHTGSRCFGLHRTRINDLETLTFYTAHTADDDSRFSAVLYANQAKQREISFRLTLNRYEDLQTLFGLFPDMSYEPHHSEPHGLHWISALAIFLNKYYPGEITLDLTALDEKTGEHEILCAAIPFDFDMGYFPESPEPPEQISLTSREMSPFSETPRIDVTFLDSSSDGNLISINITLPTFLELEHPKIPDFLLKAAEIFGASFCRDLNSRDDN